MPPAPRVDPDALDRLFAPFDRTDAPGFAVGLALNGVPQYRRGVGMASVELPVALSPSIRMRIGSTSKHFTVLAVMLLQEEGRLSIDGSPRTILPELPAWADAMTVRQLMAHTSGMRDSLDLIGLVGGLGLATEPDVHLRLLTGLESVNAAPGETWSYNNGGYVLLSRIVERLSGMPLAEFLRARIFEPVGMADTLVRPLDTTLVPNSATLHVPNPAGGWSRGVFGPPLAGEGAIVSTVDDMLRWLKHMSNPTVGSADTWAQMWTPASTHGYGLGLNMTEHRGLKTVHHAGGVIGGSSQMLKVLDHELDLVLMTNGVNTLDFYRMVDAVIDACIPDLPPAPADAGGEPTSGTFYSPATGRVLTLAAHEGAQVMTVGGMTLPARRDARGAMSVEILPTDLRVTPVREDGSVVALDVTEFGHPDRLQRVEPNEEQAPVGHYRSRDAGIEATIERGDAGPAMQLTGITGTTRYALTPLGPGLWHGAATTGILPVAVTIELDADGFRLTSGRTVRLRFERTAAE